MENGELRLPWGAMGTPPEAARNDSRGQGFFWGRNKRCNTFVIKLGVLRCAQQKWYI